MVISNQLFKHHLSRKPNRTCKELNFFEMLILYLNNDFYSFCIFPATTFLVNILSHFYHGKGLFFKISNRGQCGVVECAQPYTIQLRSLPIGLRLVIATTWLSTCTRLTNIFSIAHTVVKNFEYYIHYIQYKYKENQ